MQPAPSIGEIQHAIAGAWKLFRRDPSGAAHFGTDEAAFWKSFWCAAIVAPPFVLLIVLVPDEFRVDASLHRTVVVEAISYCIGWAAWPLVAHWLSQVLKFEDRYIPYIVAYNWSAAVQVSLLLCISILGTALNLPPALAGTVNLVLLVWLLIYHGFIIRVVTEVSGGAIFGMVLLEAVLGFVILWGRDSVLLGVSIPS